MITKILSYEELVEKRDSIKSQMSIALDNKDDKEFCRLHDQFLKVVKKIKDIDDYWNSHD